MKDSILKAAYGLTIGEEAEKRGRETFINLDVIFQLEKREQRAALDKQSMACRFSDTVLLNQIKDNSFLKPFIHDRLEEVRVEILGSNWLPGIAYNLNILRQKNYSDFAYKRSLPIYVQLELLLLCNFCSSIANSIEIADYSVSKKLKHLFENLYSKHYESLNSQEIYHEIIKKILARYKSCYKKLASIKSQEISYDKKSIHGNTHIEGNAQSKTFTQPFTPQSTLSEDFHYKVYTKIYDEIIQAKQLVSADEQEILKRQLDSKVRSLKPISRFAITKLKKSLMSKIKPLVKSSSDFGYINPKYLVPLLICHDFDMIYRSYEYNNDLDIVVTLLIDNSGSMRGSPISHAAIIAQILAKIFEAFTIRFEVLGYTTVEWQGGRSKKLWEKEGARSNPGRLSEIRHIVYKKWNEPLRTSIKDFAVMLKSSILKENIDGEALLWANKRLQTIDCKRKILIVLSDGAPVEDATLKYNNDRNLLENHLKFVSKKIYSKNLVELIALGINHDVSKYYKSYLTINQLSQLGTAIILKFIAVLEEKKVIERTDG
jgi:cobalamin biosynthesis protein CobT